MDRYSINHAAVESDSLPMNLASMTYEQPNIVDHTLNDNLRLSKQTGSDHRVYCQPETGLGNLNVLPPELLSELIKLLDLQTLMAFRSVNRLAFQSVHQDTRFATIYDHAWDSLQGILQTRAGANVVLGTLYDQFCTAECKLCGDFGGYLYILTCKRACFLCFTEDQRYLPLSRHRAKQKYGLTSSAMTQLPHLKTVPGIYSPNEKKSLRSMTLVDAESAREAGIALHGSVESLETYVMESNREKLRQYELRKSSHQSSVLRRARQPRIEDAFDGLSGNTLRFAGIVRMPWFNRSAKAIEKGFHCLGCEKSYRERPLHWRRKYIRTSFMEHIEQCGQIRDGKHHIPHGPL